MAASQEYLFKENSFLNKKAFCERYKNLISQVDTEFNGGDLKKAALQIIDLIGDGKLGQPKLFDQSYKTIRLQTGLQNKSLQAGHLASPAHYELAKIALNMFENIQQGRIKNLDKPMQLAINQHKKFITKRINIL